MIRLLRFFFPCLVLVCGVWPALAQQKPYFDEDLAGQTLRLAEKLHKESAPATEPPKLLLRDAETALTKDDPRRAAAVARTLIATYPQDAIYWTLLARADMAVTDAQEGGETYVLQQQAIVAAYGAFERAKAAGDKAAALALLGAAYEPAASWRASLNTYRASLDLVKNATVEAHYQELREKYGFRIKDYKVDSDAASPKVCFEFSENLSRAQADFSAYVAITATQSGTSVAVQASQLCIEGLKHGERYGLVLRQGLPSDLGETLLKSADYDIYVRDRSPAVRFTGRNYVLPKTGQQGIPVVSVNTTSLDLDVYRIGDRNLLPTVHSDNFLQQASGDDVTAIAEDKGQKVWSGTLATAADLNQDVITAFPVTEAIPQMKPGVYVIFARVTGLKAAESDDEGYKPRPTQWFVVSDLGLTAFSGEDGVHILVRSLASAAPLAGVELRLVARNNELLATQTSDARGYVHFDAGLARGKGGDAPALLNASDGKGDFGFLDLTQTAFDLTDRGVKGRVAPGPLDAFVYAERGVYRSGETVYVTGLLRDAVGNAVSGLPLTFVVTRPDGVEFRRALVPDQGLGGHIFSQALMAHAQSGTWRVDVYADPKRAAIGTTTFLAEDYVPERLEMDLKSANDFIHPGEPATIHAEARYLYGSPGSNLDITGDFRIEASDEIAVPALKGYQVGLTDTDFTTMTGEIAAGQSTDAQGRSDILVTLPTPEALRPLQAVVSVQVSESGGRGITREVKVPIVPRGALIGLKPLFKKDDLTEGSMANFEAVMVDASGKRLSRPGVKWTLYKIDRHYQWFFKDGRWNYEGVKANRTAATGTVDLTAEAVAKISVPVELGSYRLDLTADGASGAQTSSGFSVGWDGDRTANTPDVLDMRLDKPAYAAGDRMNIRLDPHFGVKVSLVVLSDKLQQLEEVDIPASGGVASLAVRAEWGAGAYIVALAHRPLDAAAGRAPGRAIGVAWFGIQRVAHILQIGLSPQKEIRPRSSLDIPLEIKGLTAGEEAYVTVSAVDVGILNLTHYQLPDAATYLFGQRQLALELRDLYGYLIDGMQGTRGVIRSGSDSKGPGLDGPPPIFEPLARYFGIVRVGSDGKAHIAFDIPAFNGTVRIMAVGWSRTQVGQAQTDVVIRDPVVLTATVPRFLNLGDQSRLHISLDNVDAPEGDYSLDIDVQGPVSVPATALHQMVRLAKGQKAVQIVPVAAAGVGTALFDLHLSGNGIDLTQSQVLRMQPASHALVRRTIETLPPGSTFTVSGSAFTDLLPGSGMAAVSVAPRVALDVPALLQQLDRYPYGCTEQTLSRAMPLLYVNQLEAQEQYRLDMKVAARVASAIDVVMSREDGNGSFGLWGVGGADLWLDAYAMDFLTRAREKNLAVPVKGFEIALDHLRNAVVNLSGIRPEASAGIAYATYVLARNGRTIMGDLRYMADTRLDDFASPMAKAQLAAALAMLGDKGRAGATFAAAIKALDEAKDSGYSRVDYGSVLRDSAGILGLLAESKASAPDLQHVGERLDQERDKARFTSTQENAAMILAAQALSKDAAAVRLEVDGNIRSGAFYRNYAQDQVLDRAVTLANRGDEPVRVVLAVSGIPLTLEPGVDQQGFKLERNYYTMAGAPVDPLKIKQNDRIIVALRVTEKEPHFGRLLLVDPLPAGLEIDNPNLVEDTILPNANWLKRDVVPVSTEYRDDRFVAAFDRHADKIVSYNLAYIVRAVSPGKYVLPGATLEDMYRPERFARSSFGAVEITGK